MLALITKPMGLYLMRVLDANGRTWLDPVLRPLEKLTYAVMGVDPKREHDWKQYTFAMLLFSLVSCLFHLRHSAAATSAAAQSAGTRAVERASRVQHRSQFHHQHQLAELRRRIDDVLLLADGGAGVPQLRLRRHGHRHRRRAGARHCAAFRQTIGNFWVDLVRVTYYLLIPICLVFAVFLVRRA